MMTSGEKNKVIQAVEDGTYTLEAIEDDIAGSERGEDMRGAMLATAHLAALKGPGGGVIDAIARAKIGALQDSTASKSDYAVLSAQIRSLMNAYHVISAGITDVVTVEAGSYLDIHVDFGHEYKMKPNVCATISGTSTSINYGLMTVMIPSDLVTTTGCTIRVFNRHTVLFQPRIIWTAIGDTVDVEIDTLSKLIDNELSTISNNAIANSAVTLALEDIKSQIEGIDASGLDASDAASGQVPTADGAGGWDWKTISSGSGVSVDMTDSLWSVMSKLIDGIMPTEDEIEAFQSAWGIIVIPYQPPIEDNPAEWMTAQQMVDYMTVGWNLGNSLDCTQATVRQSAIDHTADEGTDYETSWGNPKTTKAVFEAVKKKGFNTVRIPITWNHHLIDDGSGNVTISAPFLKRVKEVVDMAYNLGLIVIINTHHDASDYSYGMAGTYAKDTTGLTWAVCRDYRTELAAPYMLFYAGDRTIKDDVATNEVICQQATKLWTQIANEFKDYGQRLIFEGFNEILAEVGRSGNWPAFETVSNNWTTCMNNLNNAFISAVRATGGNNAKRVLCVQTFGGYYRGVATDEFSISDTAENKIIVQMHRYTNNPSLDFSGTNMTGIDTISKKYPIIMGEFGWEGSCTGDQYADQMRNYVSIMKKHGVKCFVWDSGKFDSSGFGMLNRFSLSWDRPKTVYNVLRAYYMDDAAGTDMTITSNYVTSGSLVTNDDLGTENAPEGYEVGDVVPELTSSYRCVLALEFAGTEAFTISATNKAVAGFNTENDYGICRYAWYDESGGVISDKKYSYSDDNGVKSSVTLSPTSDAKLLKVCFRSRTLEGTDIKPLIDDGTVVISLYSDINTVGPEGTVQDTEEPDQGQEIQDFAGQHNCQYRGKYLGTAVTPAQYAAISSGVFSGLYIGDYWKINGVNYRIAAFDYFLRTGDVECTKHHVVVVPDTILYNHVMNDTNTTTGAYVGSKMYTEGLEQAKTTIKAAFSGHVLSHRIYLNNSVADGHPSGGSWYDSEVDLMCEQMVYGGAIFMPISNGSVVYTNPRVEKSQLPLFAYAPSVISNRQTFWLRDVVSAYHFAAISGYSEASYRTANLTFGVRPYACIYGGD